MVKSVKGEINTKTATLFSLLRISRKNQYHRRGLAE